MRVRIQDPEAEIDTTISPIEGSLTDSAQTLAQTAIKTSGIEMDLWLTLRRRCQWRSKTISRRL